VLYITQDERLYSNGDGPPFDIRHLPGHKQYGDNCNNGEKEPFAITHVPGKCTEPKHHGMPGKEKRHKGFVKLAGVLKTLIPPDSPNMPPI